MGTWELMISHKPTPPKLPDLDSLLVTIRSMKLCKLLMLKTFHRNLPISRSVHFLRVRLNTKNGNKPAFRTVPRPQESILEETSMLKRKISMMNYQKSEQLHFTITSKMTYEFKQS